jgi:hypothetical protein
MKNMAGMTMMVLLLAGACMTQATWAQAQASPAMQRVQVAPSNVDLNALLQQIQQAASSANLDIAKLRIEKWKTDSEQKRQMQQVADSLQKNISNAVPGLIADVQNSRGGVVASFKLYHNVNVLYEFLSALADATGAFGKKDEYEPLAADAAAIDTARQNLSTYVEQAAARLENAAAQAGAAAQSRPNTPVAGKKIVVDDEEKPAPKPKKPSAKSTKKKSSTPSATPSAQSAASPH